MKTNSLPIVAFLAALAAVLLLPVSASAASIALAATGILSVFATDYSRTIEPVRFAGAVVAYNAGPSEGGLRDAA